MQMKREGINVNWASAQWIRREIYSDIDREMFL